MPTTTAPRAEADLAADLRLTIMRLARRLRQQSDAGATSSMLSGLAVIEQAGPLTVGELATLERVSPPTMSRIAARLEEDGLVSRTPDAHDRRSARLGLTALGRKLIRRNRNRKDLYLAKRLLKLEPAELDALRAAIPPLQRVLDDEVR